jgi:uncharacterized membrane protein
VKLLFFKYWDRIRSGFWFLPTVMAAVSVVLSYATVALDVLMQARGVHAWSWAYTGGAEGASAVLTAISGSMITIAGLVFSMTLVAMSLAASNFGPRLLQNFMRDTANQVVLGTFVATFLYCLLVLRTIRRADEGAFVPHVSVSLGVLFALGSLGVLIYFIHHVAVSIQADEIVNRVGAELIGHVEKLFPEQLGSRAAVADIQRSGSEIPESFEREARAVRADADGYLQLIDADALMQLATREDALFRVERRPGQYVVAKSALVCVWPAERCNDELAAAINAAFAVGTQRTAAQDIEYLIGQLVEIAVRALSPGINDPFTAITCIDRLSSALSRFAQRDLASPLRYDADNELRVIACGATFATTADAAFGPIRRYGRSSAEVTLRLLDAIAVVGGAARRTEDRAVLAIHAAQVMRGARTGLPDRADRRQVMRRYDLVRRALETPFDSPDRESVNRVGERTARSADWPAST